jgi:hypothetical protein
MVRAAFGEDVGTANLARGDWFIARELLGDLGDEVALRQVFALRPPRFWPAAGLF